MEKSNQFSISYAINSGLIKTVASGVVDGIIHNASVLISSVNIYELRNSKTDFIDTISQGFSFEISCPDDDIACLVATSIREKLKRGETIVVNGGFPIAHKNIVVVSTPYDYFLI